MPGAGATATDSRPQALRPVWSAVALLLLLGFNLLFTPGFFAFEMRDGHLYGSLVDIANRGAPVLLAGLGMTLVIATGGIDLSLGAVLAMAGAGAAWVLTAMSAGTAGASGAAGSGGAGLDVGSNASIAPAAAAVAAGLGVGLLAGAWNGLLVAAVGVQPIVATLVLMVAGRGIAQLITAGQVLTFTDAHFAALGGGHVVGLPVPIVLVAAAYLLTAGLLRATALRLFLEAIGGNVEASRVAGVAVGPVKLAAYSFAGLCAALAGLVAAADIRAADANNAGLYLELDAILAVVIGGTALTGGRFSLLGTAIGALVIQTLTTTILTRGVPVEYTLAVKAVVVLGICLLQSGPVQDVLWRRMPVRQKRASH